MEIGIFLVENKDDFADVYEIIHLDNDEVNCTTMKRADAQYRTHGRRRCCGAKGFNAVKTVKRENCVPLLILNLKRRTRTWQNIGRSLVEHE